MTEDIALQSLCDRDCNSMSACDHCLGNLFIFSVCVFVLFYSFKFKLWWPKVTLVSSSMHAVLELDYNLSIKKNNDSHHTKSFKGERLIVRRGEQFDLILHGRFTVDDNCYFLIAETGRPQPLGCKRATMMLHCLS